MGKYVENPFFETKDCYNVTDWVDSKINDFGNWVQGKPASAGGAIGIARVFV